VLSALNTDVPYGSGLTVSIEGIVIGGVILFLITAVITWVQKRNRDATKELKTTVNQAAVDAKQAAKDARDTRVALVGAEPTNLIPNPPPGLVEVVMGKDGKGGLVGTVAKIVSTVDEHGDLLASLKIGQTAGEAEEQRVARNLRKA